MKQGVMKQGVLAIFISIILYSPQSIATPLDLSQTPLFLTESVPPLTMLVIGRDHKLYFEAYNDATDVNGDGTIDLDFNPDIDYYGYFDSYKCYQYSSTEQYFYPVSISPLKTCSGQWSGNFLNYLTTARLDAIRKVLYGGYRAIDSTNFTALQRTYIPQDGHSWGKEYNNATSNGYSISLYTPFSSPSQASNYHLFANTTLRNALERLCCGLRSTSLIGYGSGSVSSVPLRVRALSMVVQVLCYPVFRIFVFGYRCVMPAWDLKRTARPILMENINLLGCCRSLVKTIPCILDSSPEAM